MKVLFLTAWYPHRYDAMKGLFVRKHAEAVARQGIDVSVLYLHADNQVNTFDIVEQTTNGVHEIYVYYKHNYLRALYLGYKRVQRPDICQINVLTKHAILPLWLKLIHRIPYVVVEHWSGYLPQNQSYRGFFHKRLSELTVRYASCVMPVSNCLAEAMKSYGLQNDNWQKINNVVDDFFFEDQSKLPREEKRILHVSCFEELSKNISGLLRATKELSQLRTDFELVLVGTGYDFERTVAYATELKLNDFVRFIGEQTPREVCDWFYQSDFFVLFSNYENAPVVISESLASGTPLIATRVGGIPEMFDNRCGILVEPQDDVALCDKMNWMLDHFGDYDASQIRESAQQFSYNAVGKHLREVYEMALTNN